MLDSFSQERHFWKDDEITDSIPGKWTETKSLENKKISCSHGKVIACLGFLPWDLPQPLMASK